MRDKKKPIKKAPKKTKPVIAEVKPEMAMPPELKINPEEHTSSAIENKIKEVVSSSEKSDIVFEIEKGEGIEEKIISDSTEDENIFVNPENNPGEDEQPDDEPGRTERRGRHKKDCQCSKCRSRRSGSHDEPDYVEPEEEHGINVIEIMLEGSILPTLSLLGNVPYEELLLTKAEKKETNKLIPPSRLDKPSWGLYGVVRGCLMVSKFMMAKVKKAMAGFIS